MKVAILTYHNAINYGAVLQSYALCNTVNNLGHDCIVLDYRCPSVESQYKLKWPWNCWSMKNFFAHNLTQIMLFRKKKNFQLFVKNFIPLSYKLNRKDLFNNNLPYDIYIVGGDQVFNPICNNSDLTYFLDFVSHGRKNSYSASLGSVEQFSKILFNPFPLLFNFDNLLLRETSSSKYLSEKLGKKCFVALDPVWLLTEKAWNRCIEYPKENSYILVYNLLDLSQVKSFVRALSFKTGLKIICISRTILGELKYLGFSKSASNCSPFEFLGYLKKARYVVTDSFHGASFSIIFHKKFFVAKDSAKSNTNSRLLDLLDTTGLNDRFLSKDSIHNFDDNINYCFVDEIMKKEKEKSFLLLKNILELNLNMED